jgi:2-isopropylmalate synthase
MRVTVLDSTLRDGAQGEGISFSSSDKLAIVRALDELGVDIVEAGNPGSNPKDLAFFAEARHLRLARSRIVAFGATRRRGASAAGDPGLRSLLEADTETIVIFGKSWDLHVEQVLRASLDENLGMIRESCAFLKEAGRRVIYDAEHFFDGSAANPEYALRTLAAAVEGGAECLVLCDTNGGSLPDRVRELTARVVREFGLPVGIHAHNDSGLAVANSLAAVQAGAEQVQGTLVGFGERCGNANLSTIAANLRLKMDVDCLAEDSLQKLSQAARRVAEIANVTFDEGMPYVGLHAFAHKAGMHIDAVVKTPLSFEHVPPDSVGNERRFLASEVGGRAVILDKLRRIDPSATRDSPVVALVSARLKEMEHSGYQYEGADGSLELLMLKAAGKYRPFFELRQFRTMGEQPAGDRMRCAHAVVKIEVEGAIEMSAAEGDGPVHALDLALRKALGRFYPAIAEMRLVDYKVRVLGTSAATAATSRRAGPHSWIPSNTNLSRMARSAPRRVLRETQHENDDDSEDPRGARGPAWRGSRTADRGETRPGAGE